jgi:hypothetical protein
MGGARSTHREKKNADRVLVGKPQGKGLGGRPRHRWENNIKTDLKRNRMGNYGLDSSGSG